MPSLLFFRNDVITLHFFPSVDGDAVYEGKRKTRFSRLKLWLMAKLVLKMSKWCRLTYERIIEVKRHGTELEPPFSLSLPYSLHHFLPVCNIF